MRGQSHLGMNIATGVILGETGFLLLNLDISQDVKNVILAVKDFLLDTGGMSMYIFAPLAFVLYLIGSLLPDVDTPYSMIGRVIYIPVDHRTWTHAIWLPLILCVAGIWVRLLFWLGIGVFLHDFWDAWSASGIKWFYPIGKNKRRDKKGYFHLYHTGQPAEYIIVGVTWAIMFIYSFFVFEHAFHFLELLHFDQLFK